MPTVVVKHTGSASETAASLRRRERRWLVPVSLLIVFGVWLTYQAKTDRFDEVRAHLADETVLDLNAGPGADALVPLLASAYADPHDRRFVAERLVAYLHEQGGRQFLGGGVPNVGALNTVTVSAEVAASDGGPQMRERLVASPDARRWTLLEPEVFAGLKPHLIVRTPARFRTAVALLLLVFLGVFWGIHGVWTARRYAGDSLFLPVVHLLAGIGFVCMLSLPDPLRDRFLIQNTILGVVLGGGALLVFSLLDVQRLGRAWSYGSARSFLWLGLAALLSLALLTLGSGPAGSDARVNLFGIQPMEAIKACLLVFFAGYFARNWQFLRELEQHEGVPRWFRRLRIPRLAYAAPIVVGVAVALLFFFFQRDLGPALVICTTFLVLYGLVRRRWVAVGFGFVVLVAGFWVCYRFGLVSTVASRVEMMLAPWDNAARGGEHLAHVFWALAAGGLFGQGLGGGSPLSIPAAHTDMVMAAVGEELGLLGLLAVLVLYVVLLQRGLAVALRCGSVYGFFLGVGIVVATALQLVLITGGLLGVIPLSGVVTPFLSYGMAATVVHLAFVGVLCSLSAREVPAEERAVQERRFARSVTGLRLALVGVVGVLGLRAAYIQVWRANDWVVRPALVEQRGGERGFIYNPRVLAARALVPMGTVYDRNGIPLATSDPALLAAYADTLAALGAPPGDASSELDGRRYPFGALTFYLLGDLNRRIKWGARNALYVENRYLSRLRGYDNEPEIVEDGGREIVRYNYAALRPFVRHGVRNRRARALLRQDRDLHLTVDVRLQHRIVEALHDHVATHPILRGRTIAAAVLDAATGDVLASVTYPLPEDVYRDPGDPSFFDHAAYAAKAPGSSFKLATAMAAFRTMGDDAAFWTTTVTADDPFWRSGGPTGTVAMNRAVEASSNVYFARLAKEEVGSNAMLDVIERFGFTVRSDTLTRRQQLERLRTYENLAQAGFGQGELIGSPLHVARLAAAVANDGRLAPVRWLIEPGNPPADPEVIITPAQARLLGTYLRNVVAGPSGTARVLRDLAVPAAGKTGTAEEGIVRDGRRAGVIHHAWFTGYAPYGDAGDAGRQIAVAVLVEGLPSDRRTERLSGGRHAAPIAGAIIEEAVDLGLITVPPAP